MKIACVDKTAADRRKLELYLDEAFSSQRGVVGHLPQASLQLFSLEELLYSKRPDIVVLGPALSVEEAFSNCRHIREVFPNIAIVLLFSRENYSLRVLRRFERFSKALFAWEEPPARLVHTLLETRGETAKGPRGKLITFSGVKGGVGVSSYVGALAHAASALPKQRKDADAVETALKVILVDLSGSASLLHYLGFAKTNSPEYSTMLVDGLRAERSLVERLIATAPNGISALLPPAGGREMREMWLRDIKRFELSLQILDLLLELNDIVLVDMAGAEGILPFAILAQADTRVLFSSNEAASVHLLQGQLHELEQIPGEAEIAITLNLLSPNGLTSSDVFDFILNEENFPELASGGRMKALPSIPFDKRGRHWIGTGNTLYTESGKPLQRLFRNHLELLLGRHSVVVPQKERASFPLRLRSSLPQLNTWFGGHKNHSTEPQGESVEFRKRLSWNPSSRLGAKQEVQRLRPNAATLATREDSALEAHVLSDDVLVDELLTTSEGAACPVSDFSGSISLEYALFLGGAALLAAFGLPEFYRSLSQFLLHLTQGG